MTAPKKEAAKTLEANSDKLASHDTVQEVDLKENFDETAEHFADEEVELTPTEVRHVKAYDDYTPPNIKFKPKKVTTATSEFNRFPTEIESQDPAKTPKNHVCMVAPVGRYGLSSSHIYWFGGDNLIRYVHKDHAAELAGKGAKLFTNYV